MLELIAKVVGFMKSDNGIMVRCAELPSVTALKWLFPSHDFLLLSTKYYGPGGEVIGGRYMAAGH